jgi:hypothetical protein
MRVAVRSEISGSEAEDAAQEKHAEKDLVA